MGRGRGACSVPFRRGQYLLALAQVEKCLAKALSSCFLLRGLFYSLNSVLLTTDTVIIMYTVGNEKRPTSFKHVLTFCQTLPYAQNEITLFRVNCVVALLGRYKQGS